MRVTNTDTDWVEMEKPEWLTQMEIRAGGT